jgi:hypothetical protein
VQAANWVKVYDGQYEIAYIDADNIKVDGEGHSLVWVQDDLSIHPLVSGNTTAITMIVRQSIDCRLDRVKSLSAQLYSPQGNIIVSLDLSDRTFKDIQPDTPMEAVERAVCRKSK